MFKLILLILGLTFVSTQAIAGYGIVKGNYQCHDGTKLTLSLPISGCLSSYGQAHLREKANLVCRTSCSAVSGKCGVNSYSAGYGYCDSLVEDIRYSGFTATCYDGARMDFNGCATAAQLRERASAMCAGHQDTTSLKSGVNFYAVKGRCN